MASAELAIAKASFAAVLFKPDPTSCSRDDIEHFHGLLASAITRCSPQNVQKCKRWALQNIVQSPARVASLGKYLVALANSFTADADAARQGGGSGGPSPKRRRLHILYILNDIFYHVKFRIRDGDFFSKIEPHMLPLVKSASAFLHSPRHIRKVESLIDIWGENGYFPETVIRALQAAVSDSSSSGYTEKNGTDPQEPSSTAKAKEAPYIMPSTHGDSSTPWYDLPAGNWLPVIEPNSTRPMNPNMIKPLQLAPGPPDKTLVDAVKKLLVDIDKIYARDLRLDQDPSLDIDQMGEVVERDEINGDVIDGETYYGWSKAFCQKMKARRNKGNAAPGDDDQRGRSFSSRSRSPSRGSSSPRSSSRPVFKRRRLSPFRSRSPSRGRDQRSYPPLSRSRSRGRTPPQQHYGRDPYRRSPSRSRSRDRDYYMRDVPRDSYSPPPVMPVPGGPPPLNYGGGGGYNPPRPPYNAAPPPPLPLAQDFPVPIPVPAPQHQPGFGGWAAPAPPPPPPPPHYQGQWPPPPPPPPQVGSPPRNWYPAPNTQQWSGSWAVSPPPPPPPPPQQGPGGGGYQYDRGGYGGYRGQGRGGYNRGRGW